MTCGHCKEGRWRSKSAARKSGHRQGGRWKRSLRSGRLAVLGEKNFRRFCTGYATSLLGTSMSALAVAFAVLDGGGSATELGVVFASSIVPQVLLMLGGGVIADRLGRRRAMLTADMVRCCCRALFAALVLTGHPPLAVFVALEAVEGTGDAFFRPALSGLTVEIAPAERLGDANALLGMIRPATGIAGPALAGVLVALTSPGVVLAVDAATYAVSVLALAALRLPGEAASRERPKGALRGDLAAGWAEFRSRVWLVAVTLQFTLFNLLTWGPFLLLGPVLSKESLGGAGAWGAIMACYGAGSVLGGLLALGRRPAHPVAAATVATFGYGLPCALLAVRAPVAVVAAGALVAGTGSALGGAFSATATAQQVPSEALARVSAFETVLAFSLGPLAFAAAGPVSAAVGARTVLAFGAAWCTLSAAVVLALPAVRAVTWRAVPVDAGPAPAGTAAASVPGGVSGNGAGDGGGAGGAGGRMPGGGLPASAG